MTKLEDLSAAIADEVKRKRAELQALETQKSALIQTISELEQQIGEDLMPLAVWRREHDRLVEQLKAWTSTWQQST